MASSKVDQFLSNEYESIMSETRESRSFNLGLAYGYYQLYKYLESEYGVNKAKEISSAIIDDTNTCGTYFNELIKANEEPDSKVDEMCQKLKKLRMK